MIFVSLFAPFAFCCFHPQTVHARKRERNYVSGPLVYVARTRFSSLIFFLYPYLCVRKGMFFGGILELNHACCPCSKHIKYRLSAIALQIHIFCSLFASSFYSTFFFPFNIKKKRGKNNKLMDMASGMKSHSRHLPGNSTHKDISVKMKRSYFTWTGFNEIFFCALASQLAEELCNESGEVDA